METKSNRLFTVIKVGLDIVWYLSFIGIAFMLYVLVKQVFDNHHLLSVPIILNGTLERYYPEYIVNGAFVSVQMHRGSLVVNTASVLPSVLAISQFIVRSVLLISILYNLRLVFGTIYRNAPFQYINITRLKITALLIAMGFVLQCIYIIIDYFTLKSYTGKFHLAWNIPLGYIWVAAILYIAAEILKYGFDLKKENEAFI